MAWSALRQFRVAALTAVGVGAFVAGHASCAREDARNGESSPTGRDKNTLVVARAADALQLDPARLTDNESTEVDEQIYEGLVTWLPGSTTIEPALALKWDVDSTGTIWTFHLRPNVKFHDGTLCDAAAVVYSFERQRDPSHAQHRDDFEHWNHQFKNIQRIEATDPLTVTITIAQPYAPFLAHMATSAVAVISPTALAKWGDDIATHPVGTGPFRFNHWTAGDRVVLSRNANYWGPPAKIESLIFSVVPDARQRLVALESGAADMAAAILPTELQYVDLHPDLVVHRTPANSVAYLAMNTRVAPFDDVRVRRAVNFAINKEPVVKLAYQGLADAASGPLPPSQWAHIDAKTHYDYDPDKARKLLAEAEADGHFDRNRTLRLFAPTTPRPYLADPVRVARVIASNLEAVGLHVELVLQPYTEDRRAVQAGEHDLALYGWVGDTSDPDNFLYVLFDPENATGKSTTNLSFFSDPEVHSWLLAARRTTDQDQRQALYSNVQERIAVQAPWVPLAHTEIVYAAQNAVSGVKVTPTGHPRYANISWEPQHP